ncbi:MAG: fructose-1,6-bisphosphatase [Lachnospiraceae bacterium]|nr:fructose-1,6-bisphosphatase [Lachnospiraceae bacterium]
MNEINYEVDKHYLETLSYRFPSIAKCSTEIINLCSILQLPKETEHFMTDIHGEYEQFVHIMKNGSGTVRSKIEDLFGFNLTPRDKKELATLIYYPCEKMKMVRESGEDMHDWYRTMLLRLIRVARHCGRKYTRSKVRKSIPEDFAYLIEELMSETEYADKENYYDRILEALIQTDRVEECIIALTKTIQNLTVNHLHIIGDIFDRGPGPDVILDTMMKLKSIDIQWGNHDVVWMGAACGNMTCIATVLRLTARYGNLDTIENGYGINLIPLMRFAMDAYKDDPCSCFGLKYDEKTYDINDLDQDIKMHKAIAILQFKLEGQLIKRHPEWHMEDRLLLDKINWESGTISCYGKDYPMRDMSFPTVDPKDPYKLTPEEEAVMEHLRSSFLNSERLQRHVRFLLNKGSLYLIYNSNLLFHGSMPLNEDGTFADVPLGDRTYKGRELLDILDNYVRKGYYLSEGPEKLYATDVIYFLWTHPLSPLFGKYKMTTFERYFIEDKETHKEPKTPYYKLYNNVEVINPIFDEFGLDHDHSHIINGHVPVKQIKGESPIKCGGKLICIDGGFSRAYQKTTGIAGYTLISNSYGLKLVYHEPFTSKEDAIRTGSDIHSESMVVEGVRRRKSVRDTDAGDRIRQQLRELKALLAAYRSGDIREK